MNKVCNSNKTGYDNLILYHNNFLKTVKVDII